MSIPPLSRFRAVAWDVDGTLVDSEPLHGAALIAVCAGHAVTIDSAAADAFMGVSITGVWHAMRERLGAGPGAAGNAMRESDFYAAIHARYAELSHLLRARRGAREAVAWLAAQGIAQCAVSNSHAAIVYANLRALDAGPAIGFSLSLDDLEEPKPSPAPYLQACRRLGLEPHQVLAVEDSETGLRSAVAAGLATVLVAPRAQTPASAPAWQQLATLHIDSLDALPAWLRGDAPLHPFSSGPDS